MTELERFRNNLYKAAFKALKQKHPEYVDAFTKPLKDMIKTNPSKAGEAIKEAYKAVENIPTDTGFAKWRPLLTATLDVELAMNRLSIALNLLGRIPEEKFLNEYSITEGDWVAYHLSSCIVLMKAVIEKEQELVKKLMRKFLKPANGSYEEIKKTLLKKLNIMNNDIAPQRKQYLHGGIKGADLEVLEKERHWEADVTLGIGSRELVNHINASYVEYQSRWHRLLSEHVLKLFGEIERVSKELNSIIDWDNV